MQRQKKRRTKGKSKYDAKVKSGRQMYGPGCCAHRVKVTSEDMPNAKNFRGRESNARANQEAKIAEDLEANFAGATYGSAATLRNSSSA